MHTRLYKNIILIHIFDHLNIDNFKLLCDLVEVYRLDKDYKVENNSFEY